MDSEVSEVVFKKRFSKTAFLEALNSMDGDTLEQKRDALLPNVTWKRVDGQHINMLA